ncbi:hypothetical protein G9A89_018301 [Geosiphon pyriformis]|nr:hypothetical protein G9A89_018301 [Geosiphon pyriformis]
MNSRNKFGNGVIFREGAPIKLMTFLKGYNGELGTMQLNRHTLNIIENIQEPVAIITVAGAFRRGKSFFANLLLGRHDGFDLGSQVHGCTRGIDMWDTPFLVDGKRVIILDCEGINDPEQDHEWAIKLFVFCLAISSAFIYNINGVIERNDIEKLFLMKDLTKYIQTPNDCQFLPKLVLLLRDFELQRPSNFREYFLSQLSKVNFEAAHGIQKYFGEFLVYPIAHPGVHGQQLQNLQYVNSNQFDEPFINDICNAVSGILNSLCPKYIGGSDMTGQAWTRFLEECVNRMNEPGNNASLSIPSEYESVARFVGQKAIEEGIRIYNEEMEKYLQPLKWEIFSDVHLESFSLAQKKFLGKVLGTASYIRELEDEFCVKIVIAKDQFYQKNSNALLQYNENIAQSAWAKYLLKKSPNMNETLFGKNLDDFEFDFVCKTIPGPEAVRVLEKYKAVNYQDIILQLLNQGSIPWSVAEHLLTVTSYELEILRAKGLEQDLDIRTHFATLEMQKSEELLSSKFQNIQTGMQKQQIDQVEINKAKYEAGKAMNQVQVKNQLHKNKLIQQFELKKMVNKDKMREVLKVISQLP